MSKKIVIVTTTRLQAKGSLVFDAQKVYIDWNSVGNPQINKEEEKDVASKSIILCL